MDCFWDTSAVVPLILREVHTPPAVTIYQQGVTFFAWDWMQLETEAALSRRQAQRQDWETWGKIRALFQWVHLPRTDWSEIQNCNREWRLRAADAAHMYAFTRLSSIRPSLRLITFDSDQIILAQRKRWPLITSAPKAKPT